MKPTPKKQPVKLKGKPGPKPSGRAVNGRIRPILQRTSVAAETLAGIQGEGRPAGRVIDDMWQLWIAARRGEDLTVVLRALRQR